MNGSTIACVFLKNYIYSRSNVKRLVAVIAFFSKQFSKSGAMRVLFSLMRTGSCFLCYRHCID